LSIQFRVAKSDEQSGHVRQWNQIAARADGTSGISLIKVQIDAQGAVTSAAVSQGTGNSSLDLVALAMARGARYSPALHECKPVAAAYTFSVKFYAW